MFAKQNAHITIQISTELYGSCSDRELVLKDLYLKTIFYPLSILANSIVLIQLLTTSEPNHDDTTGNEGNTIIVLKK